MLMKPFVLSLALATFTPFAFAETGVVFESSFEAPVIQTARLPKALGGNIVNQGAKPQWLQFEDQPVAVPMVTTDEAQPAGAKPPTTGTTAGGGIVAGIAADLARTGEQSLYLQADKLSVPYAGVVFSSAPIRVLPGKEYVVGIWGRNDPKNPLAAGSPQLYLKLQVDFFGDEGVTQTGDSEYLLQALPGGVGYEPTFISAAWRQLRKRVVTPADANYMVVTYRCDLSPDKGSVSGAMYFDDVTVEGEVPASDSKLVPVAKKSEDAEEGATAVAPKTEVAKPDAGAKPAQEAGTEATATPTPTKIKAHKKRKTAE